MNALALRPRVRHLRALVSSTWPRAKLQRYRNKLPVFFLVLVLTPTANYKYIGKKIQSIITSAVSWFFAHGIFSSLSSLREDRPILMREDDLQVIKLERGVRPVNFPCTYTGRDATTIP